MKKLAILGSTGSIGTSALDVVGPNPDKFEVVSLAAATSVEALAGQIEQHRPKIAAVLNAERADALRELLPSGLDVKIVHGPQGYLAAALEPEPDLLLSAMVGAAGLLPTYAAVEAGVDLALANKETLVAGGELVMAKARERGAAVLPVDSEHSALFQCLMGGEPEWVETLWLTASGGPFREMAKSDMAKVTPEMALKHPNWSMGPKISIDSSTLMNKGLEVIEARWLFDQPMERIKVVVHPQSMVHSMVQFIDGNFLAQIGPADMRLPIAFALDYPKRSSWHMPTLDITELGKLSFEEPDLERFPALGLAFEAGKAGGLAGAVLNAANEVAVERFLAGGLDYPGIPACVEAVLAKHQNQSIESVRHIMETDLWARREARSWLDSCGA